MNDQELLQRILDDVTNDEDGCAYGPDAVRACKEVCTRIAELEAENKQMAKERDGWKREAEAWRALGIACETFGGDVSAANQELDAASAANDARAGGKEDGHG